MFRAALYMIISDFKVSIVFVALGLPFPWSICLLGGGGGGGATGFQFKKQTQAVEFPQVLLVLSNLPNQNELPLLSTV